MTGIPSIYDECPTCAACFHLPNEQFGKTPCVKAPVIREIWLAEAAEIVFLKHLSKSLVFDE